MLDPVLLQLSAIETRRKRDRCVPVRIAERDEAELSSRIDNKILRHLAHVHHDETRPHEEFCDEVAVRNAPEAVLGDGVESELAREEFAVDAEGVPGERAAAKRQYSDARDDLAQALEIAAERERVRKKEMCPADRLTALCPPWAVSVYAMRLDGQNTHLEMGVPWEDKVLFVVRAFDEDADKRLEVVLRGGDLV